MRRFTDEEGRRWDVVLGRESWGTMIALFVPVDGRDDDVRQVVLQAESYAEAQALLGDAGDVELRTMLERGSPKTS